MPEFYFLAHKEVQKVSVTMLPRIQSYDSYMGTLLNQVCFRVFLALFRCWDL